MVPACRPACARPSGDPGWLGPRPALPTSGPIVVAQTSATQPPSSYTSVELRMPQPQTVIELLAEDGRALGRALGRATIRYSTGGRGPCCASSASPPAAALQTRASSRRRYSPTLPRTQRRARRSRRCGARRTRTPPLSATCSLRGCCRVLLFRGVDGWTSTTP